MVLDGAVAPIASAIPGLVHPGFRPATEWIGNKPLQRELRPVEVPAGEAVPPDEELAGDTDGDRLPASVEDVDLGVVDGPPDRNRGEAVRSSDLVKSRIAGRLRRAVKVEQDTAGDDFVEAATEVATEHFPARHPETEMRKTNAQLRLGLDHRPEQRGNEGDPRHPALSEHPDQPLRLPHDLVGDHSDWHALEQRTEGLPDRVDEAGGSLLTAHLSIAERIRAPHPAEAVDSAAMQPQDSLGSARRS